MLDDKRKRLVNKLFDAEAFRLQEALDADLNEIVGEAAKNGATANGRFHLQLATRVARDLSIRADCLWATVVRVLDTSPAPATDELAVRTKEVVLQKLEQERQHLEGRLAKEITRFRANDALFGRLNDAFPRVRDKLFAEIEFRVVEQSEHLSTTVSAGGADPNPTRVFVVHGRDGPLTQHLFSFLRAVGLHPMEWGEALALTGKTSPYVGEILDKAIGAARAIVVLLTPDDEVRLHESLWGVGEQQSEIVHALQPRPNVLFESGMAFGRYPDRTILVEVGAVKQFSDIAGRHVLRLTNEVAKREDLVSRLKTAGCAVALNGDEWRTIGDFAVERKIERAAPDTSPSVKST